MKLWRKLAKHFVNLLANGSSSSWNRFLCLAAYKYATCAVCKAHTHT